MLPLRVALALSLVLVLRLARLPVPSSIPVLHFLWHAPAIWVEEHQHIFSRVFDPDPNVQFVIRWCLSDNRSPVSWLALSACLELLLNRWTSEDRTGWEGELQRMLTWTSWLHNDC